MRYLYVIILTMMLLVLQRIGANSTGSSTKASGLDARWMGYRMLTRKAVVSSSLSHRGPDEASDMDASKKPYGLDYNPDKNTWTLYGTVLQLKNTSIYGRPGEIAQIEYSLDGERPRHAWIVVRIDNYSFGDDAVINIGQNILLYVSGTYVSPNGVDWENCPRNDKYCMNAGFIEGGFPQSEDYDGLTLCPSNTIVRSGYAPDDWINGMLAWRISVSNKNK